jgi:O-antigen/teichoic acid export membrane protein
MLAPKSMISQFFSGTLAIGIARVSTVILGIVSMMIAVRHTSREEYGAYVLVIVITAFIAEFMSFGMTLAIPKYLASHDDESYPQTLKATVLSFRLLIIVAGIALVFVARALFGRFWDSSLLFDLTAYVPVLFALSSLSLLFSSILRGQFRFGAMGIIEVTSDAVELAALILMVVVLRMGLRGLFYAKFISGTLYVILGYFRSRFPKGLRIDLPVLKELLKFGFPLQLQYALDFSYSRIDTMIIGALLGTGGIAYYEIARKIPDSLMQLYSVFASVYFPISAKLYAREAKEKTESLMNHSLRVLAFLTILGALTAVVFGKDIIRLLFSEAYLPSYFAFVLLMLGLTLNVLENTLGYSLVAIGDSDKPLIVNVVRTVLSLIGNLIFLPLAGFVGAAFVSVGGNLAAIPLDAYFLWKRKLRPNFTAVAKPASVLVVFSLVFIGLGAASPLLKIAMVVLYLPVCFFLSVVTSRDLALLSREARQTMTNAFKKPRLSADP